jgi:hypothetical protein
MRPRQPLSRSVDLKPLQISVKTQWMMVALVVSVPVALLAVYVFPNAELGFQTFASPGSALANVLQRFGYPRPAAGPFHLLTDVAAGLGMHGMVAFAVNELYYTFLIFWVLLRAKDVQLPRQQS